MELSFPRFGGRRVRYRHYLDELARKPQAVRQVAPELVAELGEPFGRLWSRLEPTLGAHEAARSLARLLRLVGEHGEERVREVVEQALEEKRFDELTVERLLTAASSVKGPPSSAHGSLIPSGLPAPAATAGFTDSLNHI